MYIIKKKIFRSDKYYRYMISFKVTFDNIKTIKQKWY